MINASILIEKFNMHKEEQKLIVSDNLVQVLDFLKNTPEFDFNILTSIVAVNYDNKVELIYQLFSLNNNISGEISYFTDDNTAPSVISVFKSAYFDECEIFDMFGIKFIGNDKLKRLYMPDSWVGHPLLKSYRLDNERLVWNE